MNGKLISVKTDKKNVIYIIKEHWAKYVSEKEKGFEIGWYLRNSSPGYIESNEGIIRGLAGLFYVYFTSNSYKEKIVYFCGGTSKEDKIGSEIQKDLSLEGLKSLDLNTTYKEIVSLPLHVISGKNTQESIYNLVEDLKRNYPELLEKDTDMVIITSGYHTYRTKRILKEILRDISAKVNYITVNAHNYLKKILNELNITENIIYEEIEKNKKDINLQRIKYYIYNFLTIPLRISEKAQEMIFKFYKENIKL